VPITHVQSAQSSAFGSGTAVSLTITSSGSGDVILGTVAFADAINNLTSITTNKTDTGTLIDAVSDATNANTAQSFAIKNCSAGITTVTANFSVSEPGVILQIDEYSGTNSTIDNSGAAHSIRKAGTAGGVVTANAVTTTTNGCLIWVGTYDQTGVITAWGAGTGFTLRNHSTTVNEATEDEVQSTAGAITPTINDTGGGVNLIAVVAIQPSASADVLMAQVWL
jgi:hypothetical protein